MPRKTPTLWLIVDPSGNASMRPRPDATENPRPGVEHVQPAGASMRPRPDATENVGLRADLATRGALQ